MAGKPYTISEYNHPFPNRYHWEMFPVLAAYASYHDADGLMFFNYNDGTNDNWEEDFIDGFFGIHRNNTLMSLSPIFAYAYRHHLIGTAQQTHLIEYDSNFIFNFGAQDNLGRWGKYFPYDRMAATNASIRTKWFTAPFTEIPEMDKDVGPIYQTPNAQLFWSTQEQLQIIDAPRIQSLTGNLGDQVNRKISALELISASDEGVISWVSLGEEPLVFAEKSLFSLHSRIQNTDMVWDGDKTVHDQWGRAPTLILPLKVKVKVQVDADSLQIYPLETSGKENSFFTVFPAIDGSFMLEIDQNQHQTPWFGIRAFLKSTPVQDFHPEPVIQAKLAPNPATSELILEYKMKDPGKLHIALIDLQGRGIQNWVVSPSQPGLNRQAIPIVDLVPGLYIVQLRSAHHHWQGRFSKQE